MAVGRHRCYRAGTASIFSPALAGFSFFCPAHRVNKGGGNSLLDFTEPVCEHGVPADISLCHGALWEAMVDQDANLILGDTEAHSERNEGVAKHMRAWQVANLFSFHLLLLLSLFHMRNAPIGGPRRKDPWRLRV